MASFHIKAEWDKDARVWWARSDDIPGLVAEADTHDGLVSELRHLVPELLAMNLPAVDVKSATFTLVSEQVEELCAA